MRLAAAGVHDIERRAGHVRDHDGAVGGFAFDLDGARISMPLGTGDAAREQRLLHPRDDIAVLGMHERQRAEMGAARKRVVEFVVVNHQRALVSHEVLEGVDAVGFDDDLHLVEHLLSPRRHRHVETVVGGRLLGFAPPVPIGREHRLPRIGNPEIYDHGGAARQCCLGAPFEIIRRDAAHERQLEMGVRIDAARHHKAPAGVDRLRAGGGVERGANRDNGLGVDKHVGAARIIMVHDRAAADDESCHGIFRTGQLQGWRQRVARCHPRAAA